MKRVLGRLVGFIDDGLLPPCDVADPVQWRPRLYNTRADWLCNQALDTGSSFEFIEENLSAYCTQDMRWETFSDGGCRGNGKSAFAWVVHATWVVGGQCHRFTVAFGYEHVDGNYSSFATELWGLEKAVRTLRCILDRTRNPDN